MEPTDKVNSNKQPNLRIDDFMRIFFCLVCAVLIMFLIFVSNAIVCVCVCAISGCLFDLWNCVVRSSVFSPCMVSCTYSQNMCALRFVRC